MSATAINRFFHDIHQFNLVTNKFFCKNVFKIETSNSSFLNFSKKYLEVLILLGTNNNHFNGKICSLTKRFLGKIVLYKVNSLEIEATFCVF
jgi:hypothetical protein